MNQLTPRDIARARVVDRIDITGKKGVIVVAGRQFQLTFDDVLDLVQAIEMIMLKTTGKLLGPKFRPTVRNRKALSFDELVAGDYSLYDGSDGVAPVRQFQECEVVEQVLKMHYIYIKIVGTKWHTWFARIDELIKALYIVVREAQGDPYVPAPAIYLNRDAQSRSVTMSQVGHA